MNVPRLPMASADHTIVARLTSQLAATGVSEPRAVAIRSLIRYGILDTSGRLTAHGAVRNAMTPEERAIDRAARASGNDPGRYVYDPATNRATLRD